VPGNAVDTTLDVNILKAVFGVRTVMGNLEKSWNYKSLFQAWKSHGKNLNHKSLGKIMEICYNHMFIYAEFEIIDMFFKERRSKYEPAYALNTQHF